MSGLEEKVNIGLDGQTASGKDTFVKIILEVLNNLPDSEIKWEVVDSSAMYRGVGLFLHHAAYLLNLPDIARLTKTEIIEHRADEIIKLYDIVLQHLDFDVFFGDKFSFKYDGPVYCDGSFNYEKTIKIEGAFKYGKELFQDLHSELGSDLSGKLGAMEDLRKFIDKKVFSKLEEDYKIVPGRDGFSLVKQAKTKTKAIGIYIDADKDTRKERRAMEMAKDTGQDIEYCRIILSMQDRDALDASRTKAPEKRVPQSVEEAKKEPYGYQIVIENSREFLPGQHPKDKSLYHLSVKMMTDFFSEINYKIGQNMIEELVTNAFNKLNYRIN